MKRNILISILILSLQCTFAHELLDVASGKNHSLLLFENGKILPFGHNDYGQLGLSKTINFQSISEEKPLYIDTSEKFISIAVGLDFSLAVSEDGTLWGWGNNANYQLGLKLPQDIEKPQVLTDIKGWKKVFAGGYESLALKDDGTLWDLRTLEIIKNPNNTIWKDVKVFGENWGFGDYTLIVILQDIDDKFWIYGTCTNSSDDFSIVNSFIDKNVIFIDNDTIQPIIISPDITSFQVTDLSGFYRNKSDIIIFGLSVANDEEIQQIKDCKESVYNYLSDITINKKNKNIRNIVMGNFSDKVTLVLDISQSQNKMHYYSYSALLQKNGKLIIYTNGKKMISDKNVKISKIFGGSNIFVQADDDKVYGIGYFYSQNDYMVQELFSYYIPINY